MTNRGSHFSTSLFALVAISVWAPSANAQSDLRDFSLEPSPAPTPEAAQGPVDSDVPAPTVQSAPTVTPQPLPSVRPPTLETPRSEVTTPQASEAPDGRSDADRTQSETPRVLPRGELSSPDDQRADRQLAPPNASSSNSTDSATDSLDQPDQRTVDTPGLPAPDSQETPPAADLQELESGTSLWPWLMGAALLLALLLWLAFRLLADRRSRADGKSLTMEVPESENLLSRQDKRPVTGALPVPPPAKPIAPNAKSEGGVAATVPADVRTINPEFSATRAQLSIDITRLETTLLNLVLTFRATVTAPEQCKLDDVRLFARLAIAHRARSIDELTRPMFDAEAPLETISTLAAGAEHIMTGTVRLALADTDPIRTNTTLAIIPVAQFKLVSSVDGISDVQDTAVLLGLASQRGDTRIAPIRLDKGPRLQAPLHAKVLYA
jgi:hypothetical protein